MTQNNNAFSFARFSAYLKMLWVERWRTNLMRTGILFGFCLLITLWLSFVVYKEAAPYYSSRGEDPVHDILYILMGLLFLCGGCIIGNEMLKGAKRKGERIMTLTMPVTPLENWLARWTMCVPLYLIVFIACFYAADSIRVLLFSSIYANIPVKYLNIFSSPLDADAPRDALKFVWLIYFYVTAVYVLGGVFFPKKSLLKTSVCLFLLFWLGVFSQVSLSVFKVEGSSETVVAIVRIYFWLSVFFLWWLSYRRFKELEVIDRM